MGFLEDFCSHADVEEGVVESTYGPCTNCEKGMVDLVERREEKFIFCCPGEKTVTKLVKCPTCDYATDLSYYTSVQEQGQATAEKKQKQQVAALKRETERAERLAKRKERQAKRKEEQELAKRALRESERQEEEKKEEWNERLSRGSLSVPPDVYLDKIANEFREHCIIQDRKYRLYTYRNCFIGSEAIDALVKSGMVVDREHAVTLGRRLQEERDLFAHVTKDHGFVDKPLFYRFMDDEAWKDPKPPSLGSGVRKLKSSLKKRIVCPITGKLVCAETGRPVEEDESTTASGEDPASEDGGVPKSPIKSLKSSLKKRIICPITGKLVCAETGKPMEDDDSNSEVDSAAVTKSPSGSLRSKAGKLKKSLKKRIICPITGKLICPETGKVIEEDDSTEAENSVELVM